MAPKKVRVNSVNPGGVITNILMANHGTNACQDREEEKKVTKINLSLINIVSNNFKIKL